MNFYSIRSAAYYMTRYDEYAPPLDRFAIHTLTYNPGYSYSPSSSALEFDESVIRFLHFPLDPLSFPLSVSVRFFAAQAFYPGLSRPKPPNYP